MNSQSKPFVLHTRVVSGAGGGPEKTILNSPRFLKDLGYTSACLYLHPPNDPGTEMLRSRAAKYGAEFIGIEDKGPFDFSLLRKLVKVCHERKVEIWHAHDYKSNVLGLLVKRRIPSLRLITTLHGWVQKTWKTPLYYTIDKFCLSRYDEVIAVSDDLFDQALKLRVPQEKLSLIHNGIDTQEFKRSMTREEARKALGMPTDAFLIGGLGRLSKEKGFDLLIRAVENLIQEGLDLELWIGGEGQQREKLEQQFSGTASGRVKLLGLIEDPKVFFQALDLFVLSSIREGLPNVLLEAMALETPVLSTRVAGIPSLIAHQEHGVLIDSASADELIGGIKALHGENPAIMARNARTRIEADFDFQVRMQKIAAIYDGSSVG